MSESVEITLNVNGRDYPLRLEPPAPCSMRSARNAA